MDTPGWDRRDVQRHSSAPDSNQLLQACRRLARASEESSRRPRLALEVVEGADVQHRTNHIARPEVETAGVVIGQLEQLFLGEILR